MERVINMIIRQIINRVVRAGVTKGIDVVADRLPKRGNQTPEEQDVSNQQTAEMKKRARETIKMTRRMKF